MPESIDGTDLEIARECGARERKFWDADEVSMVVFTPDQLTAFADRIRAQQREHDAAVVAEAAYDAAIRYANGHCVDFEREIEAAFRTGRTTHADRVRAANAAELRAADAPTGDGKHA